MNVCKVRWRMKKHPFLKKNDAVWLKNAPFRCFFGDNFHTLPLINSVFSAFTNKLYMHSYYAPCVRLTGTDGIFLVYKYIFNHVLSSCEFMHPKRWWDK